MGSTVYGQDPLWLAWVNDLINYKDAGNMSAYQHLINTITPARFKVGQMIGASGLVFRHYTCNVQKSRFGQKKEIPFNVLLGRIGSAFNGCNRTG